MPVFLRGILFDFLLVFGTLLLLKYFPGPLRKLKFAWRRLAHQRSITLVLAGAIPVLLHLAFYPRPEPAIHDEFSYLLQADTFAHGRLANPPRPLWEHFEQFHVLSQPVFASKYQPMSAVFLAAGQKLLGDPYFGLLLTAALTFCAALWMFYGWLPPSYALFAWLIAVAKLGPTTYWMNSYWGGLTPALGGFLVMGAWIRLRRGNALRDSILLGLGIVVLAASRPFEGFLIAALACASLLWIKRQNFQWMRGAGAVVAAGLLMLGFYNYKVTGEPLRLPYQLYGAQYEAVGNFVFQRTPDQSLTYHHAELKALMYDRYVKDARSYNLPDALSQKLMTLWTFFCTDWPLSLPLLALPFAWSNQRFRWALMFLLLFLLGMGVEVKVLPHYYAPGACLLLVAMMGGLHRLRYWNPQGKPTGSLLARIVVAATIAIFIKELIHKPVQYSTGGDDYKELRRGLIAELNAQPGKHLILVRYGPNHNPDMDFVVNGADVNSSRILWARSMNPQADRELVEYFHDRRMWFLDGDREAPQLEPLLIDLTARR